MKINWKSFAIVRDKKFHVEIRVSLMKCLFDENLLRLIFDTQIHIRIHIRYFKSLP